jgi:hypothetical protein
MEAHQDAKGYFKHILLNVVGFYDLSRVTISTIFDAYYNDKEIIESLLNNNVWCQKLSTTNLCKILCEYDLDEEISIKVHNEVGKRVIPLVEALKDENKFNQLTPICQSIFKRIKHCFNKICKRKSAIYIKNCKADRQQYYIDIINESDDDEILNWIKCILDHMPQPNTCYNKCSICKREYHLKYNDACDETCACDLGFS